MKVLLQKSYYLDLLPMDLLYKVLELFTKEEQNDAQEQLSELLDYVALRTILNNLSDPKDKIAFLEVYRDQYDQNFVLDWALLKTENIDIRLRESLERTLLAVFQRIQSQN